MPGRRGLPRPGRGTCRLAKPGPASSAGAFAGNPGDRRWEGRQVGNRPCVCNYAEARLPAEPRSVPVGRHFVSDLLEHWGAGPADPARGLLDDIALVVDELLANAARYTTGEMDLKVVCHAHRIDVVIGDDSSRMLDLDAPPAGPDDEGGRGLEVVGALCARWGQHHAGAGKEIWCWAVVPAGSALAAGCRDGAETRGTAPG